MIPSGTLELARAPFGGTTADIVLNRTAGNLLRLSPAVVTMWDSQVGGVQYIDLFLNGSSVDSIRVGADGQIPVFSGPEGVHEMWADTGSSKRVKIISAAYVAEYAASADASADRAEAAAAGVVTVGTSNDAAIAGQVNTPTSASRAALDGLYAKKNLVYDAREWGSLSGSDASAVLNQAAADVKAISRHARLVLPAQTINIASTFNCAASLDADQAVLNYTGAGVAMLVGGLTNGVNVSRQKFSLPEVVKDSAPWDGTTTGVRIQNMSFCDVYVPYVANFETGLLVYGLGTGMAYSTINLGALWQNHKNLELDDDSGAGFCNQNTFLGGRLQQSLSAPGSFVDDTNAGQITIGRTSTKGPNTNTFINTSFEGNNPAYYRLHIKEGRYNRFYNCRWERFDGQSRVRYGADAQFNVIDGGHDAHLIDEFFDAGSDGNELHDRLGAYIKAANTTAQVIPSQAAYTTLTGWTTDSHRAPINGSGSLSFWTPRQGRWRISATVAFNATSALGQRRIRLLAGGGTVVDVAQAAANGSSSIQQTLKVNGVYKFDGSTSLVLQASQDSGADLALSSSGGYVVLDAEYVGP